MEIFLRIKQLYNTDISDFSFDKVALTIKVINKIKEDEKNAEKGIMVISDEDLDANAGL